jgi:D-alanine-D-alanine ligase
VANKLALLVLVGGQSTEHEISILSANNVVAALDKSRYDIAVAYITPEGQWFYINDIPAYLSQGPRLCVANGVAIRVNCMFGESSPRLVAMLPSSAHGTEFLVDVVFPLIHGTHGEDGSLQGLLEIWGVAYVGANVLASAIGMNKAVTKQILDAEGVATTRGCVLTHRDFGPGLTSYAALYTELAASYGRDLFVKPASLGSSVGVAHVRDAESFQQAVKVALSYDRQVLVEERIKGREIECAVLGNQDAEASLPAEIVCHHDFYSYEAKYLDPNGASAIVPAKLDPDIIAKIRTQAIKAFHALGCAGMLRVDFFLQENGVLLVNEVNSIPGFTSISMYPKMWQATGLSYSSLLDRLVELGIEYHAQQKALATQFSPEKQNIAVE